MLWSNFITPSTAEIETKDIVVSCFEPASLVAQVRCFKQENKDFALPDRRAARSMSRNSCLLTHAAIGSADTLQESLARDPFSVGLYCAVENGSLEYDIVKQVSEAPFEKFAEEYKRLRNPKMYLKQLPNLAAAQLGIFLQILGPMGVFTHSEFGSLHALEQANLDLRSGVVKLAVVCAAMSAEDPLNLLKHSRRHPALALSEAALCLVLDQPLDVLNQKHPVQLNFNYGILNSLVSKLTLKESAS